MNIFDLLSLSQNQWNLALRSPHHHLYRPAYFALNPYPPSMWLWALGLVVEYNYSHKHDQMVHKSSSTLRATKSVTSCIHIIPPTDLPPNTVCIEPISTFRGIMGPPICRLCVLKNPNESNVTQSSDLISPLPNMNPLAFRNTHHKIYHPAHLVLTQYLLCVRLWALQ